MHKAAYQHPIAATANEALLSSPTTLQILGVGSSRLHKMKRAGLIPPPVCIGKSARWVASEIRAVVSAITSGHSTDDELRALSLDLIRRRAGAHADA